MQIKINRTHRSTKLAVVFGTCSKNWRWIFKSNSLFWALLAFICAWYRKDQEVRANKAGRGQMTGLTVPLSQERQTALWVGGGVEGDKASRLPKVKQGAESRKKSWGSNSVILSLSLYASSKAVRSSTHWDLEKWSKAKWNPLIALRVHCYGEEGCHKWWPLARNTSEP